MECGYLHVGRQAGLLCQGDKQHTEEEMSTGNRHQLLDALIEQDACFDIYRLPGEASPRFVMQRARTAALYNDIEALNGESGFVIAPFRISPGSPLIVIRPDCTDLTEVDRTIIGKRRREVKEERFNSIDKAAYRRLFHQFHTPLLKGENKKLVLSRSKTIGREETFCAGRAFYRAAEKYTRSFVFLFHTPQSGTWLGSTPEIL